MLKTKEKYFGTEGYELLLREKREAFFLVHRRLKKIQGKIKDWKTKIEHAVPELKIGDHVYLKTHRKTSKVDEIWLGGYIFIELLWPVTYKVKNQLTNHSLIIRHSRLQKVDSEWAKPADEQSRKRKARDESTPDALNSMFNSPHLESDDYSVSVHSLREGRYYERSIDSVHGSVIMSSNLIMVWTKHAEIEGCTTLTES